ncbi:MAG: septal ring lytic transglycosylase RlpA family protein [Bryobacteraceae bacterium]
MAGTRTLAVVLAAMVLISGCHHRKKTAHVPPPPGTSVPGQPAEPIHDNETGIASWYGHPYHGRASASGEIYDMEQMTAAHRTLPFGTIVRVHDLDNEKTVDVRINDRGPFVDGRVIDLSHAAARVIEMIGPGIANVRLEILSLPAAVSPGSFAVQVGSFRVHDNAERLRRLMESKYGMARLVQRADTPGMWHVLVGLESTQAGAVELSRRICGENSSITSALVVRVDSI